jgi:hypothetical protein
MTAQQSRHYPEECIDPPNCQWHRPCNKAKPAEAFIREAAERVKAERSLEREGGLDEISKFNGDLLDEIKGTNLDYGVADEAERFLEGY